MTGIEWAGIIGVSPWEFSLKELYLMMTGRQRAEWDRAAQLIATVKNLFATKKSEISQPVNPYRQATQTGKDDQVLKVDKKFMTNIFEGLYGNGKRQHKRD